MRGVKWVMGHGSHWRSGTQNELHVNNDVCPHLMWYQKTNAKEAIMFTFKMFKCSMVYPNANCYAQGDRRWLIMLGLPLG
jgi:hypothetical protein